MPGEGLCLKSEVGVLCATLVQIDEKGFAKPTYCKIISQVGSFLFAKQQFYAILGYRKVTWARRAPTNYERGQFHVQKIRLSIL